MSDSFDPMDCSPSSFSVHGIFQVEYWSGLPFPPWGDLPKAGIEIVSPVLQDYLPLESLGKLIKYCCSSVSKLHLTWVTHKNSQGKVYFKWEFPGGSYGKSICLHAGDLRSILGGEDPLKQAMVTHSSTLAWKIPWREEPGRLQSMGSQRVGHYWATSL